MSTSLYRVFDAVNRLLYVGITDGSPFDRLAQHGNAGWVAHAFMITLERYQDRKSAAAAELAAIRDEDPVWNINGRPIDRYMKWMIAYPRRHADDISDADLKAATGTDRAAFQGQT